MIADPEFAKNLLNVFADEPHWPSRLKISDVQKVFPERSRDEIVFHLKCCKEAELLDATITRAATFDGVAYTVGHIDGLTQKGSEFVLASRNPKVWTKAVDKCEALGGHISLALLVDVLGSTAKGALGLP